MSTLQQIRDQLRALISETDSSNTHFTDAALNELINQGVRYTATLLEWPRDMVEVQAEEGVGAYTLLSDTMFIRTAYFGDNSKIGDILPLEVISEETLKEFNRSWLEETTTNRGRPRRLIVLDKNTIYIDPPPNADESVDGKKIILNYVFIPATLTTDGQQPDLPVVAQDLVSFYAAHLAYFPLNQPDVAAAMLNSYDGKLNAIKHVLNKETKEGLAWQWGAEDGVNDETDSVELIP